MLNTPNHWNDASCANECSIAQHVPDVQNRPDVTSCMNEWTWGNCSTISQKTYSIKGRSVKEL